MLAIESVAAVLVLLVVLLAAIALRRRALEFRGGTIELSWRLRHRAHGRGWVFGIGRFVGDELEWYRVFSLAPRPRRILSRHVLTVVQQRPPTGGEVFGLLAGAVVLECVEPGGQRVEVAMDAAAVTGFLAWLESGPPGATLPRLGQG